MFAWSSPRRRLAILFLLTACGESSHVYEGRLFSEDRRCLASTSSVDVVSGDRPGTCAAACLIQPLGDGGRSIYVSTMCGPYPFGFRLANEPPCDEALAALSRGDTCKADGTSTHPAPDASAP
jgi:hypothetical protein